MINSQLDHLREKAREMAARERAFWKRIAPLDVSEDHARRCLDHTLHKVALGAETYLDPYAVVADKLADDPSWQPL